jgi:hypothetical protein
MQLHDTFVCHLHYNEPMRKQMMKELGIQPEDFDRLAFNKKWRVTYRPLLFLANYFETQIADLLC